PWGGYMFLNGWLPAGATEPLAHFGEVDAALDLRGATHLVFHARGEEGGETVEFFLGGLGHHGTSREMYADSTAKVSLITTLSQEWQQYEIPLVGVDLSRIACGFGWVANDTSNQGRDSIRFALDEIYYRLAATTPATPFLLHSYAPYLPGEEGAEINNFAYLYDNAVALLTLCYAGEEERARQIADAMVYAVANDRTFNDGRLRNAYMSGDPRSFPGWQSSSGHDFARLPGFYDFKSNLWLEDVYAVSTSTGNLAWTILALCEMAEMLPERADYLEAAGKIGDLVLTLGDTQAKGGGFSGGFQGHDGDSQPALFKSTEHNIDLITAFARLGEQTGEGKYQQASAAARSFVLSMYDAERGCFYTGTEEDGVTISKEIIPLDCQTWALLVLGEGFKEADKVLGFIEEHLAYESGYSFSVGVDGIHEGVWFEGTAQVALCYLFHGQLEKYQEIMAFLNDPEHRLPDGGIYAADRNGLPTGFYIAGSGAPWTYDQRQHLGATAWLSLAQQGRNPLNLPPLFSDLVCVTVR
ncbi:MAG: hypothetical protein FWF06_00815, partial [Symbiobacteriaceae bacterium]|nr:hypothetical protein [Symbiobacteriaceae bacterium]